MTDDYRENFYKDFLKIDEAINGTSDKGASTSMPDQPELISGTHDGSDAVD